MSRRMADTFFPAAIEGLRQNPIGRYIYDECILPASIDIKCPAFELDETFLGMEVFRIRRQPCLLVAALIGMYIGLSRAAYWHRNQHLSSSSNVWALAFGAFGLMNLSATFAHSLSAAPATNYPTDHTVMWMMDTYMTGVSGSSLLVASLMDLAYFQPPLWRRLLVWFPNHSVLQLDALRIGLTLTSLACIAYFLADPFPSLIQASLPLELWYLIPCLVSSIPVFLLVAETPLATARTWTVGRASFLASALVIFVLGLLLDQVWCHLAVNQSPLVRDFWNANTLLFLGCDFAFCSLDVCLHDIHDGVTKTTKKE